MRDWSNLPLKFCDWNLIANRKITEKMNNIAKIREEFFIINSGEKESNMEEEK